MRIFFVSTFVGTFLPASVGGDAVRAYALAQGGRRRARVGGVGPDGPDARRAVAAHHGGRSAWSSPGRWPAIPSCSRRWRSRRSSARRRPRSSSASAPTPSCRRLAGWLPWDSGPGARRRACSPPSRCTRRATATSSTCWSGRSACRCCGSSRRISWGWRSASRQPLTTYVAFIPLILLVMLLPVTDQRPRDEPVGVCLGVRPGGRARRAVVPAVDPVRGARRRRQPAGQPAVRQRRHARPAARRRGAHDASRPRMRAPSGPRAGRLGRRRDCGLPRR